jgi:AraC-like DNA-binding protein
MQTVEMSAGEEWRPRPPSWLFIQVSSGVGYSLERPVNVELPTGAVLVLSPAAEVNIRASLLGSLNLLLFRVTPELLTGLLAFGEQLFLEKAAVQLEYASRVLAPNHPAALKLEELAATPERTDFVFRLALLEVFALTFAELLKEHTAAQNKTPLDAKERLEQLLGQILVSDWLNLSFNELVQKMNCTPRHLSRVFREIAGMSFREKQSKIRLARASELLRTTESKVVDVALESGFQSLSLFNLMFRKRFGLSPGRWRKQRQQCSRRLASPPRERELLLAS